MKKLFLSLLVALLPLVASAENVKIGDLWYEVISKIGEATVIKSQDNSTYSGKIVIPETVEYNGKPYSVTSIGISAFSYCSGLTSIAIPNSVTSIGGAAFYRCNRLTSITIPNSVTSIGSSAFYGCSGLTSVEIPNSVTSIGGSAFSGCSGLTSVTIPNSVTSIGNEAFYNCYGLTSITIPNSVTSIGNHAFYSCSGLTSVEIPNSVTSIGGSAFKGCSGLTSVTIPNSVTSIDSSVFYECSGLTSVTIPNSVTSIGGSAFASCYSLTSVTIPNSVTSIGDYAFQYCSGLTSVTIGNSVTSIGSKAFANCAEITNVYCLAEKVPSTNSNAFENSYIEYVTLHVPASSIEKYKATTPWSSFGKIEALVSDGDSETQTNMINGHEYVDLGLPSGNLWAKTNYGASTEYAYGTYMDWTGRNAINTAWGKEWSTPTSKDMDELCKYCTFSWGYNNSVYGCFVKGSNGNKIFLPAAGFKIMGNPQMAGESVYYWGDTEYESGFAIALYGSSNVNVSANATYNYTLTTMPIRPVSNKSYTNMGDVQEPETCAIPTITYQNGKLVFGCETEGAVCHSTITDSDIASYTTNEVTLTATYNISVYARKEGYKDSEVAKATLCWIDVEPKTEGVVETEISNVKALPVMVQVNGGMLTVSGANDGTKVEVFTIAGAKVGSAVTSANTATVNVSQLTDKVIVVKVGNKTIKVMME